MVGMGHVGGSGDEKTYENRGQAWHSKSDIGPTDAIALHCVIIIKGGPMHSWVK